MTELYFGGRRCGKTAMMIRKSAETRLPIVVPSGMRGDALMAQAREMGLNIPTPITIYQLHNGKIRGTLTKMDGVYVDDLNAFIEKLFAGINVKACTVNADDLRIYAHNDAIESLYPSTMLAEYCKYDIEATYAMLSRRYDDLISRKKSIPEISKVIYNDPATIVIWKDGSKTVVKSQNSEPYDPEKGLAMAISKKALGNEGSYYDTFKKHLPEIKKPENKCTIELKVTGNATDAIKRVEESLKNAGKHAEYATKALERAAKSLENDGKRAKKTTTVKNP